MKIIGLTGGIATGKSTVAGYLEELGATIIDADQLSRAAVVSGSPALARIREQFGSGILLQDGGLDRQALRTLVFQDSQKRQQLEAILHPAIRRMAEDRLAAARQSGHKVVVYMAPLLVEANAAGLVDEIWVVSVRTEVQLERLMNRDSCNREAAQRIVAAQMPLADKERYGVVVIDNSGSLEETRRQVIAAWQQRIAA